MIKIVYRFCTAFGWDPLRFWRGLISVPYFFWSYLSVCGQNRVKGGQWRIFPSYPQLQDRFESSGVMKGHYFHQDIYVANRIFLQSPVKHLDVGSRIDGFISHLATFRSVDIVDIRPNTSTLPSIKFVQADLTCPPASLIGAYESVSCLHALEHFGLGRYGDDVDLDGHVKGMAGLAAVVQSGGILYFSVPIGRPRIEFNAHRIFSLQAVSELYAPYFELERFTYVDDSGNLGPTAFSLRPELSDSMNYSCGIFELRRKT